jgi:hypothetical protein
MAIVSALSVISLFTAAVLFYTYFHELRRAEQEAIQVAEAEAARSARRIETSFAQLKPVVDALAKDLGEGSLRLESVAGRLRTILSGHSGVSGIGVATVTRRHDPEFRRSSPYYVRGGDGKFREDAITLFSVPVYHRDPTTGMRTMKGEVVLDYSREAVREIVASLNAGKIGYGFLISDTGEYLDHPVRDYVSGKKNIFELAAGRGDEKLATAARKALQGERGLIDYRNEVTGQSSWIVFEPVPTAHWALGTVFVKNELTANEEAMKRRKIRLCLSILTFLAIASMLLVRIDREQTINRWLHVIFVTCLLIAGILWIWHLTIADKAQDSASTAILDQSVLDKFLQSYTDRSKRLSKAPPLVVPTGVHIQSIKFTGANEVALDGYVWQKYTDGIHDGLARGLVMPQASKIELTEAYRRRSGSTETIGWTFQCTLSQHFDLGKYPFDVRMVSVRMMHRDFDRNVLLTPDLVSYPVMNPAALPGVRYDFTLPNWALEKTYFSFRTALMNATMGIDGNIRSESFPDLYFNILTRREIVSPIIAHLLPVFVAISILFAVMLVITKHKDMQGRFGFTTLSAVGACSGLFFGVLLAHARLRGEVQSEGFTYIEYFHFLTYLATLLIAINSFLFSSSVRIGFIQYRDNLYPKLLFWPTLFSIMLGLTLWTFY